MSNDIYSERQLPCICHCRPRILFFITLTTDVIIRLWMNLQEKGYRNTRNAQYTKIYKIQNNSSFQNTCKLYFINFSQKKIKILHKNLQSS